MIHRHEPMSQDKTLMCGDTPNTDTATCVRTTAVDGGGDGDGCGDGDGDDACCAACCAFLRCRCRCRVG